MMNGSVARCSDSADVRVTVGGEAISLNCLVSDMLPGYSMLLGMDAIRQLGGVRIASDGGVVFGDGIHQVAATAVNMNDKDYQVTFADGVWNAKWEWADGQPAVLTNRVPSYRMSSDVAPHFDRVIENWIEKGWLQPFDGQCDGIVPLLAVVQENKNKVRPVLDYRELNQSVSSHTAESEVCGEKLRRWRRMGKNLSVLDLRDAYLQIRIDKSLWKFQVVEFKGRRYCLTRLGFGLSAAPKIMAAIVHKVLSFCPRVASGTDSYVDDVIVDENKVSVVEVRRHLEKFGLECKDPVPLDDARVLGLRVRRKDNGYVWERDNLLPEVPKDLTRRQLFSICGQLTGHYPVAGWLRPACSLLKRLASSGGWDEAVSNNVQQKMEELFERVRNSDPVQGRWDVPHGETGSVWCDASSIAVGVAVEIDGCIVEDNSWLRKEDDCTHINLAELESVVKGINAAVSWGLSNFIIYTDSATVNSWIRSITDGDRKAKTHGLSEVLVRRRLFLIKSLLDECDLTVQVKLVSSANNKADQLTRVPQKWVRREAEICSTAEDVESVIQADHSIHHFGVDRTLYLVTRSHPGLKISRASVDSVVKKCVQCARIDPAPVRWEHGDLSVAGNWERLAADVTHFAGRPYLTFIDCGPSRFTLWKRLSGESTAEICERLEDVCREHGPPQELLLDNALSFKSGQFVGVCHKWGIYIRYRCAHRASGNGIVERVHRTIKRMAARSGSSVLDMTYWYNIAPKERVLTDSIPAENLFTYEWRVPRSYDRSRGIDQLVPGYWVGQRVFVKPGQSGCTTVWPEGRITRVVSSLQVEVDGVPRHVADVRPVPMEDADEPPASAQGSDMDDEGDLLMDEACSVESVPASGDEVERRYPQRNCGPPDRFGNLVVG